MTANITKDYAEFVDGVLDQAIYGRELVADVFGKTPTEILQLLIDCNQAGNVDEYFAAVDGIGDFDCKAHKGGTANGKNLKALAATLLSAFVTAELCFRAADGEYAFPEYKGKITESKAKRKVAELLRELLDKKDWKDEFQEYGERKLKEAGLDKNYSFGCDAVQNHDGEPDEAGKAKIRESIDRAVQGIIDAKARGEKPAEFTGFCVAGLSCD